MSAACAPATPTSAGRVATSRGESSQRSSCPPPPAVQEKVVGTKVVGTPERKPMQRISSISGEGKWKCMLLVQVLPGVESFFNFFFPAYNAFFRQITCIIDPSPSLLTYYTGQIVRKTTTVERWFSKSREHFLLISVCVCDFVELCARCQRVFPPEGVLVLEAMDKTWHVECFRWDEIYRWVAGERALLRGVGVGCPYYAKCRVCKEEWVVKWIVQF